MPHALLEVEGFAPVEVHEACSLLVACESAGLPMRSDCGGFAACNACRVRVLSGADRLSPIGGDEGVFLDEPGQRLGCQARLLGGAVSVRLEPGD